MGGAVEEAGGVVVAVAVAVPVAVLEPVGGGVDGQAGNTYLPTVSVICCDVGKLPD